MIVFVCEYFDGLDIFIVFIDNVSVVRKIIEYLINIGYIKIVYIMGFMNIVLSCDWLKGYR